MWFWLHDNFKQTATLDFLICAGHSIPVFPFVDALVYLLDQLLYAYGIGNRSDIVIFILENA